MSDEKSQQEPTMEEILASIRRIISENDDGDAAAPAAAGAPVLAAAAKSEPKPAPKPETKPEAKAEPKPAPVEEEDVLELTDVVAEEPVAPADEDDGDDLVVEDLPAPEPDPVAEPDPAPVSPPVPPRTGDDRLVSDPVAAASTAALGVLALALNRDNVTTGNIVLGSGNTLEYLVKDMIRPMLREWLDQNLAQLVERLVKREIERMVRRAEDL